VRSSEMIDGGGNQPALRPTSSTLVASSVINNSSKGARAAVSPGSRSSLDHSGAASASEPSGTRSVAPPRRKRPSGLGASL
jgi:hypothetical protein